MNSDKVRQVARLALNRLGVKRFAKEDGSPEPVVKSDKAPVFYSHAERVISEKVPNSAHPDQVRKTLLNNGVKPEEMKWSGLDDHLASATGPVKKSDLLERVRDGNVKVGEVLKKSEPEDMSGPARGWGSVGGGNTKYDQYQLPGGSNYHEMLLTLPSRDKQLTDSEKADFENLQHRYRESVGKPTGFSGHLNDDEQKRYGMYLQRSVGVSPENYKSSHWDEPNVLAHIRFNDREGPNGEKLLHVEEIQSDWHQKGRKELYAVTEHEWRIRDNPRRGLWEIIDKDGNPIEGYQTREEAQRVAAASNKRTTGVPDAPFKKTWHELALRRAIRYAAEHGYDGVTLTPGDEQNKRYPNPNRPEEAMKKFYDEILPAYLEKIGKKFGAKVGETRIGLAPNENKEEKSLEHILRVFGRNSDQYQRALAGSLKDKKNTLRVPFFPITPAMKESVVREGQALFAKRSEKDRFSLSSQPQSFASSLRRLGTKQQLELREIAARILHQSGLTPHKLSNALHDTPTDSRPGVAQAIFRPVSPEHTRRAAAQYGLVAGQNSLLVFHGHPEGPDSLYAVDLPGGDESRKMLDRAGFDKRTLIPTKTGFRAIIHDPGRASRKKMEDFATGAGISVTESTGYGEMVGDKKPEKQ